MRLEFGSRAPPDEDAGPSVRAAIAETASGEKGIGEVEQIESTYSRLDHCTRAPKLAPEGEKGGPTQAIRQGPSSRRLLLLLLVRRLIGVALVELRLSEVERLLLGRVANLVEVED